MRCLAEDVGAAVGDLIDSIDVMGREDYLDAGLFIECVVVQSIEVILSPCSIYRSPS